MNFSPRARKPAPPAETALDAAARRARRLLHKRALVAAAAGVVPVPGLDWAVDAALLSRLLPRINAEFGLTPEQLDRLDPSKREQVQKAVGLVGSVLRYLLTRQGPMTSPPAEFGGYLKTDPSLPYNDVQVFGLPVTGDPDAQPDKTRAPTPDRFDGLTLAPYQVRPFSRGSIRLRLPDVNVHPVIRMNYLDDERDRRALLWALRFLRNMATQPALAALIDAEVRPGAAVQTDAEWLDWLAPHLTTGYHPVGTCRMGRADDAMAVVTPDLKVRGVQGLRVIDASVMPNVICGNTNATSVVIGDKGADLVLGQALLSPIED